MNMNANTISVSVEPERGYAGKVQRADATLERNHPVGDCT